MRRQKNVLPGEGLVVTLQRQAQGRTKVMAPFEISFCGNQFFLLAQVKHTGTKNTGHFVLDARGLDDLSLSGKFFHLDDLEKKAPGDSKTAFNQSPTSVMFIYRRKVIDEVTGLLLHINALQLLYSLPTSTTYLFLNFTISPLAITTTASK